MRKKPNLVLSSPPDDIIEEILVRVSSVKSLLRFKSLSKSCYNIISTAKFAKTHLQKYGKLAHDNAILIEVYRFVVDHCPVDDLFLNRRINDGVINFKLDYPFTDNDRIRLVGCSNGLCCVLVSRKDFLLFNPFTQKTFTVPPAYDEGYGNEIRGFGYDESNDDYKVFAKSLKHDFFRMYSLKTNSWKTLDNFIGSDSSRIMTDFPDNSRREFEATGVLLNGKLHWSLRSEDSLEIVSFDLGSEAVGVVEPPTFSSEYKPDHTMLGVLEGCLCIFRGHRRGSGSSVWTMKEYVVGDSWDRLMSVPQYNSYEDDWPNPAYPLYVHEGDVLAIEDMRPFFYKPRPYFYKRGKPLIKKNIWHVIGFCIQSLVSPFPPICNEAESSSTAE